MCVGAARFVPVAKRRAIKLLGLPRIRKSAPRHNVSRFFRGEEIKTLLVLSDFMQALPVGDIFPVASRW